MMATPESKSVKRRQLHPLPHDADDQIIAWSAALRMMNMSRTTAYNRAQRDPVFRRLRFVMSRARNGQPRYAARVSEIRAYLESLRDQQP